MGELVFIPYIDNLMKIFPTRVGLYSKVRPLNTISSLLLGRVAINY